jgi:hypothetical protein
LAVFKRTNDNTKQNLRLGLALIESWVLYILSAESSKASLQSLVKLLDLVRKIDIFDDVFVYRIN